MDSQILKEIKGIRSYYVMQYGVVVNCQSHKHLATENRPGQIILRNLVARLPESCLIARILPDCRNLAWLPNLCIGSYVDFATLPEFSHVAGILPDCLEESPFYRRVFSVRYKTKTFWNLVLFSVPNARKKKSRSSYGVICEMTHSLQPRDPSHASQRQPCPILESELCQQSRPELAHRPWQFCLGPLSLPSAYPP